MRCLRIVLLAVLVVGCGKKDKKPDEAVEQVEKPPIEQQVTGESKCHGNKVPPTNYMQETAFVPADSPGASEEAGRLASAKLRDRICQGYRCTELAPKIKLWNTEADSMQVCAMAVIKSSEVEEFKAGPRKRFDADLTTRAEQLVKTVKANGEPRIAFDNITDVGVDGGPRAEWLVDRMSAALSKHGALIASLPTDWTGLTLPKGVDAVLRANITPMHGREAVLEVTWKLQLPRGVKAVDPISFPELIGPAINPLTQLDELAGINPNIALRFDARDGGGLCNGQRTELRLESSQALHVRVINLFGDGSQGMVIYGTREPLKPQEAVSLGEFDVVKATPVPAERFLVVGAETEAQLGQLADIKAPCKLSPAMATQLSSQRGLPDGVKDYTTSRSYRILEGPECSSFEPEARPEGWFDKYMRSMPSCL